MDSIKVLVKIIISKGNAFLALQRSEDSPSRALCWDFPGGNLEFGEDIVHCITREIQEETSLTVKDITPLHVISALDKVTNIFWVEIGYRAKYSKGKVQLSKEHSTYKWLTKREFLKLNSADYLKEFVRRMNRKKK